MSGLAFRNTVAALFSRWQRATDAANQHTVRLYPPPSHIMDAIEQAALAGGRLSGECSVCGRWVEFMPFTDNPRESGHCPHCGSSNRQRQMAWMLRRELGMPFTGPLKLPPALAIYNTEANGPLHAILKGHACYACSEYWGEKQKYGEIVDGVRNEDLQALSFADASFDVVLSSDVLEHVPEPYRAHREIFRVLKSGGRHIFTVPFGETMVCDDVRASLVGGEIVYHAEALYHGDPVRPDEGVLVWTIFGLEMLVRLKRTGFDTEWLRLHDSRHGIVGPGLDAFVACKGKP